MTLGRYIVLAAILFLAGIIILFTGINRAPFRQAPPPAHPAKQHGQVLMDGTPAGKLLCRQETDLTPIS